MSQVDIHRTLDSAGRAFEAPVVTIGNFDGVHLGHEALFKRTRELARTYRTEAIAVTFSPHPVRFFRPETEEFRLTSDETKFDLIDRAGLDAVLALDFDHQLAELAPEAFVETILERGLGASGVVVGANFAFGKDRAGTTDDLERLARDRGIACEIYPELELEGEPVSSTRIRTRLRDGDVERAAQLLGRHYRLSGTVVRGEGRGRELGYPTANLAPEHLVPRDGVYATRLHRSDTDTPGMPAATSIGVRPVFDETRRVVESYVLDAPEAFDLYDEHVAVEFVARLRGELDFDSVDELVEQMGRDVEDVRERLRLDR